MREKLEQNWDSNLPCTPNGSIAISQSQHNRGTVTAQSRHSHITVTDMCTITAHSQHSHSTEQVKILSKLPYSAPQTLAGVDRTQPPPGVCTSTRSSSSVSDAFFCTAKSRMPPSPAVAMISSEVQIWFTAPTQRARQSAHNAGHTAYSIQHTSLTTHHTPHTTHHTPHTTHHITYPRGQVT